MAVAIRTTDFPEGVGTEMYDGVQAAMDIANDPPDSGPQPTITESGVHNFVKP